LARDQRTGDASSAAPFGERSPKRDDALRRFGTGATVCQAVPSGATAGWRVETVQASCALPRVGSCAGARVHAVCRRHVSGGSGSTARERGSRRLLGACRIADPTTAGDFLRRFKTAQDVERLSGVIDEIQEAVWSKLARKARRSRKKHDFALVDLDGHIKSLYGVQKEGASFSYDGRWSYQPLVVSLGGSEECLKVVNQPGSARPSDVAAAALKEVLPRVRRHFRNAPRAWGYRL
jgi:hypothetical protein